MGGRDWRREAFTWRLKEVDLRVRRLVHVLGLEMRMSERVGVLSGRSLSSWNWWFSGRIGR